MTVLTALAWGTLLLFLMQTCKGATGNIAAGPLEISPQAHALIVKHETGGEAYYRRYLSKPSWPGGQSGVTVGIGYDVGYNTKAQVLADWKRLPEVQRNALATAAGVKGALAKQRARGLRWFGVPWPQAKEVFEARSMPRFGVLVAKAFPGVTTMHPHVQGVMLSLGFNRGTAMAGASRLEMRQCREAIPENPRALPGYIRRMKRLWVGKGLDGLLQRREEEACLIERAL